jgi:hypothetical protein
MKNMDVRNQPEIPDERRRDAALKMRNARRPENSSGDFHGEPDQKHSNAKTVRVQETLESGNTREIELFSCIVIGPSSPKLAATPVMGTTFVSTELAARIDRAEARLSASLCHAVLARKTGDDAFVDEMGGGVAVDWKSRRSSQCRPWARI